MNNNELLLKPFEFDSPVEFVLIGVAGKKRAVVAKSKGAQLDLIAYAQRESNEDEYKPFLYRSPFFFIPFQGSFQLEPLAVNSNPTDFPGNHPNDSRPTECTLIWRGSTNINGRKKITKEFQKRITSIVEAIEQKSTSQLEWVLSPIIDECHKTTVIIRGRRIRVMYMFWVFFIVYLLGSAYLFNFILN